MTYYHDLATQICEDTGQQADTIYTDHARPGIYNSCRHCNKPIDVWDRMRQINASRKRKAKKAKETIKQWLEVKDV